MKKVLIVPVLAGVLCTAACGDGPTAVAAPPKARFFNAVWNAPDGVGFTTNGQFAAGSALGYGESTQSCLGLAAGNTTFGIGLANASGTGLNSSTLGSLADQTLTEGGNYTILAGGQAVHPSLVLLDNSFSGNLGGNQAAVRFVNLAASSQFPFTVMKGTAGSGTPSVVHSNIAFRAVTPFSTVASGSNAYTIMYGQEVAISGSDATLNLQGGSVNTVVIVRKPSSSNYEVQLVNVPSCS